MLLKIPDETELRTTYYIKNKDEVLATFVYTDNSGEVEILHNYCLPALIASCPGGWLKDRVYIDVQGNGDIILEMFKLESLKDILDRTYGVSLTDTYWITSDTSKLWNDVSPFRRELDKRSIDLFIDGERRNNRIDITASPTFSTDGFSNKCWVSNENGLPSLYKGICTNEFGSGREPINEVLASQVLDILGYNHAKYALGKTAKGTIVSYCDAFTSEDVGYRPMKHYRTDFQNKSEIVRFMDNNNVCIDYLKMLLFDYVVLNEDRSYANFGMLVRNDNQKIISLSPIYDNGMSMLANWDETCPAEDYIKAHERNMFLCDGSTEQIRYVMRNLPSERSNISRLFDFTFDRSLLHGINCSDDRLQKLESVIRNRAKEFVELSV